MTGDPSPGDFHFGSVPLTPEMVRDWDVENRSRWARRRSFRSLDDAFDAYGLQSTAARELVRAWGSAFVADPAYRWMFYVTKPFVDDAVRELDQLLASPGGFVRIWMPPTAGYLAIGGLVPTASDDPVDGERIAAQIYKTHLEVLHLAVAGQVVDAQTIWYPGERPHPRAPAARRLSETCPTCGLLLPATGTCDDCG
ncbi:hypothetical protein [Cellulomonas sp. KRMCY2]|uniref:hypothetical protein n=1 Tax=Cellulomonas sp. KRMCY2 TaxID=1304865 RepID=UPI00045E87BF|nr:hypothetical protein [Cellulomonas sp. KRMCY2]